MKDKPVVMNSEGQREVVIVTEVMTKVEDQEEVTLHMANNNQEDMNNPDKIMDNKEDIVHLQQILLHKAVMSNNQEVERDLQRLTEHKEVMTKLKDTVNNNQEVMLSKVDFLSIRCSLLYLLLEVYSVHLYQDYAPHLHPRDKKTKWKKNSRFLHETNGTLNIQDPSFFMLLMIVLTVINKTKGNTAFDHSDTSTFLIKFKLTLVV